MTQTGALRIPQATGAVSTMSRMFYNAAAFNQAVGEWDTSTVTDMAHAFRCDSGVNCTNDANGTNTSIGESIRPTSVHGVHVFTDTSY